MIKQFRILSLVLFVISGCSIYPNKFKCEDAKGLDCMMLHEVDRQIDSGKIEQIYKKKKCNNCCGSVSNRDGLRTIKKEEAKLYKEESKENLKDNNLYF